MLTELHTEFLLRGVKRILYECSSILVRTPSIHPKHKASSTDSGHVMLVRPEPTL
jgi:hypothetical protein